MTVNDGGVGFIGLGAMGSLMSANLVAAGHDLSVYDAAGTVGRAPSGSHAAESSWEVAGMVETVLFSLPDGDVVNDVLEEILTAPDRKTDTIVDLSTIGVAAAEAAARKAATGGIDYLDAPVSGGVSGAKAASLSLMASGPRVLFDRLEPILKAMAAKCFYVGDRQGQGQAMKLTNNILAATATAATSEAVLFGLSHDLTMEMILNILNVSTGGSHSSENRFPNTVLTGSFDSGFSAALMRKDTGLYKDRAMEINKIGSIGSLVADLWAEMSDSMPEADSSSMYEYIAHRLDSIVSDHSD